MAASDDEEEEEQEENRKINNGKLFLFLNLVLSRTQEEK